MLNNDLILVTQPKGVLKHFEEDEQKISNLYFCSNFLNKI